MSQPPVDPPCGQVPPTCAAHPQQGVYPPQGVHPQQGAYPHQGAYPQQGAYPPQGAYPVAPPTPPKRTNKAMVALAVFVPIALFATCGARLYLSATQWSERTQEMVAACMPDGDEARCGQLTGKSDQPLGLAKVRATFAAVEADWGALRSMDTHGYCSSATPSTSIVEVSAKLEFENKTTAMSFRWQEGGDDEWELVAFQPGRFDGGCSD